MGVRTIILKKKSKIKEVAEVFGGERLVPRRDSRVVFYLLLLYYNNKS
jgi:hypothetical protein